YHPLRGALLLDVGGGPGFFARAFEDLGAKYVAVDADAGEMRLHGRDPGPRTVQADGTALPFPTGSFDVTYSSNVLEHVAQPWRVAEEMVQVTEGFSAEGLKAAQAFADGVAKPIGLIGSAVDGFKKLQ
ncbi:MAG: class I SAM-dependent methyltransferase, partial [Candidatus Nanopelagicales bacterium]